ncbi:carboxymethylenebutenolidase [Arenibacter sp. NBRC 103722]|uniref:dienelactone hydrolase family protein n=1 Tax=Arenibacter sp. NBRC 103722 TaxID=1113929 RepID=UPI00085330F8|nr:dienelactone hydrolase family protein [Arenibacter sp. NBRC 103722]GBF19760.1 carboxymethylenebutenolidase [Arenibacter sp. NBRC 103722]
MKLNLQILVLVLGFSGILKAQGSKQLSDSLIHAEWVDFERDNGSVLKAFVVYPESRAATKAVIVIHENLGLNEWIMTFSEKVAGQGFLVISPDLISNRVEGIEKTTDFENNDKVRDAIYALDQEHVTKDLNLVYNYVENDPAVNGRISVVGFGWGGSQSFSYAAQNPNLENVMVYYGAAPQDLTILKFIKSPVYGFYGAADNKVNMTIPDTEKTMKDYGNLYTFDIYEDAGHAFMSRGAQEAYGPNNMAYEKSWKKLISLLK